MHARPGLLVGDFFLTSAPPELLREPLCQKVRWPAVKELLPCAEAGARSRSPRRLASASSLANSLPEGLPCPDSEVDFVLTLLTGHTYHLTCLPTTSCLKGKGTRLGPKPAGVTLGLARTSPRLYTRRGRRPEEKTREASDSEVLVVLDTHWVPPADRAFCCPLPGQHGIGWWHTGSKELARR